MRNTPQRFIILAGARTGSTFLKNMLRSHPEVTCFGEVFNKSRILWDLGNFNDQFNTPTLLSEREEAPPEFLNYVLNLGSEAGTQSVGVKMLYRHFSLSAKHTALIPFLLKEDDIKIIHLKRRNSFKTYCSLKIANLRESRGTSMNAYSADDVERNISLTINPDNCLKFIETTTINESKFDTLFKHKMPLNLTYESLSTQTAEVMDRVLRFLDLKPAPLSVDTYKVRKQPISEVVSNYEEVAEYLTAKGYGEMFAA